MELVERARKPAPKEVLMAWATEWAREDVRVDWEKLLVPKGYQLLSTRWVVERTFSWIEQNRRISKNYERLTERNEAFIYVVMRAVFRRGNCPAGEAFRRFQRNCPKSNRSDVASVSTNR